MTGLGVALPGVLLPVFVQVLLCFVLLAALVVARSRKADVSARIGASYSNQFEMPVLFFALVPLVLITRTADPIFVALEWMFVVTRLMQAGVHVTINVIALRSACFALGGVALTIAWIRFAVAMLSAM